MSDLVSDLKKIVKGDVENDDKTLRTFSHDASIFDVKPKVVVFPKNASDIEALVKYVAENKKKDSSLSLTGRSAGTDMGGGPLNESIIVNFQKYFTHIKSIKDKVGTVEPGVFYRDFEVETLKQNLIFPSYPASRGICAMGGILNNNSGGEKSLQYGTTEKYIRRVKVVLSDGKTYEFKSLNEAELNMKMRKNDFEGEGNSGQKTAQERSSIRDGAVKDRTLRVLATDSKDVEQVLSEWNAQLSASNSRLEITTTSRADVANAFSRDQQYDAVAIMADLSSDRAQRAFWHSSQLAPLGQNYAKWFNPSLDDAIEALERSSANEERLRLREKIKEILSKDVPAGIYPVRDVPYVISDKLKGVEFLPIHSQSDRFKSIEGWYLKGKRVQ